MTQKPRRRGVTRPAGRPPPGALLPVLTISLLLCCSPVGLILMWAGGVFPVKTRGIITGAYFVCLFGLILAVVALPVMLLLISPARNVERDPDRNTRVTREAALEEDYPVPRDRLSSQERAMRRGYEAYKRAAYSPSSASFDSALAERGKGLVDAICNRHELDPWYKSPRMFGPRMVIWIPEVEWTSLTREDRAAIAEWLRSQYANWGIGVGRVNGNDVLSDRLVVESP